MMMNHEIWGCLIFRQAEIDMNGKIFSPSEKGFFVAHQLTVPAFYKCGMWLPLLLRYSILYIYSGIIPTGTVNHPNHPAGS